ncbi:hypothetical protein SDC9_211930 [bioreactor metagenome]|uniref:Uncharacterized protein n=1 Tax=bioreactor metagenome TaxID=1076179 RepID=A0A645JN25_9ZZZZ
MRNKAFHLLDVFIGDLPQLSAAHHHMKAQRHLGKMGGKIDLEFVQSTKCGQMGADKGPPIQQDVAHHTPEGQPAILNCQRAV